MAPKTRWIITGAAGFIGSYVADYLLMQGCQIVGIDNFSTGSTENVARLAVKHGENWKCLHADIRDAHTMLEIFDYCRADHVAHFAAQVSVPLSILHPIETHDINVTGFLNIILAAKNFGVKKFIYTSSSAVYGEQKILPTPETASLHPLSMYGLSKKVNEEYADLFSTENFNCIGLRLFNIFGPHQRADSPYSGVIAKWLTQLHAGKPLIIYGDGTSTRDFCDVSNVALAIQQLVEATLPHTHAVYNIGTGHAVSMQELGHLLLSMAGYPSDHIQYGQRRIGDILHSQANIQLAQKEFNYHVLVDLEEGLSRMIGR